MLGRLPAQRLAAGIGGLEPHYLDDAAVGQEGPGGRDREPRVDQPGDGLVHEAVREQERFGCAFGRVGEHLKGAAPFVGTSGHTSACAKEGMQLRSKLPAAVPSVSRRARDGVRAA